MVSLPKDWWAQLTVNRYGVIKVGSTIVSDRDLDPLVSIKVSAIHELQWRFPQHTIWLVNDLVHIIRREGNRLEANWSDGPLLEGYCAMNSKNLLILADYLDTVDQTTFSMGRFCQDDHGEGLDPQVHECGTVACAAGQGPNAGFPVEPEDHSWANYVQRVFGINTLSDVGVWCFGGFWEHTDNTSTGAAKRIRHLVNHGLPENANDQRCGKAPYLFALEAA